MNVKLAKLIVEKGYLTLDNLKTAVEEQKNTDKSLGIILIDHGFITEKQLLEITNFENLYEVIELSSIEISEEVINLIPKDTTVKNNLIPFDLQGSFLSVAMLDPSNILLIDELRFLTGFNIKPYIAEYSVIRNALSKYYGVDIVNDASSLSKVKVDQHTPDSQNDDLAVDIQNNSQLSNEVSTKTGENNNITSDFSVREVAQEPENAESENLDSSIKEEELTASIDDKSHDSSAVDENNKSIDRIDIFNLSPDEIKESESYNSNNLKDYETTSTADLNLKEIQTSGDIKADTREEDTIAEDVNPENLFKAPLLPEDDSMISTNLFHAPQKNENEQADNYENLFQAPVNTVQDTKTEKEFGIPFKSRADEQDSKLELQTDNIEFSSPNIKEEVQMDAFTAFSRENDTTVNEPSSVPASSFKTEENAEKLNFEAEIKESIEIVEYSETQNINQTQGVTDSKLNAFLPPSSMHTNKSEEALSTSLGNEHAEKPAGSESNSASLNVEPEAVILDNSDDNLESLKKDLEQIDTQFTSDANVTSSQNNGNYDAAKPENENILQLEDDTLEQEEEIIRPTVLLVDDSPSVQKIVSVTLNRRGYNVEVSSNAMQALAKLNDCIPDIIFLDINLPHMDGYQLCKVIKSNELTKTIPVVMLSGKDGFFDKIRGKMVGATDYITKPFEPNTLVSAIEKQGITIARTN